MNYLLLSTNMEPSKPSTMRFHFNYNMGANFEKKDFAQTRPSNLVLWSNVLMCGHSECQLYARTVRVH